MFISRHSLTISSNSIITASPTGYRTNTVINGWLRLSYDKFFNSQKPYIINELISYLNYEPYQRIVKKI